MSAPRLSLAERDHIETGICLRCGHSHAPENRQRIIRRMVGVDDVTWSDIAMAWPCFYGNPAGDRNWPASRGRRRLMEDLKAIRTSPAVRKEAHAVHQ